MAISDPKDFLTKLFKTAIAAADPAQLMHQNLPEKPKGRTLVIGAGKASAAMAVAFEDAWQAAGNGALSGVVVTAHGNERTPREIKIVEAAHPVPDSHSEQAAKALLETVADLTEDDLVVALISGGGSSLLSLAAGPLTTTDKQAVNSALLAGGVPIAQMNCIRKHLSAIKGGRLAAAAHPARVVSLVLSDIPGDDPALVASGPTIPDATIRQDALEIVARYNLDLPASAMVWLNDPASSAPHPTDKNFHKDEVKLIAAAHMSLEAAARQARELGIETHILSDAFEGEATVVGQMHAALATHIADRDQPFTKPCLLLSGGETTVTLRHKGKGGRNTEFLLALAHGIEGKTNITALAGDTDGIDGSEDNAGAYADGQSLARMRATGIDPTLKLHRNDAYSAFASVNDLIETGPTATNVNDFRGVLIQ